MTRLGVLEREINGRNLKRRSRKIYLDQETTSLDPEQ